eukprot:scaffold9888_cov123-Isochrysis_galbana.AAC.3
MSEHPTAASALPLSLTTRSTRHDIHTHAPMTVHKDVYDTTQQHGTTRVIRRMRATSKRLAQRSQ